MRTLVPEIVEKPLPTPATWKKGQSWFRRYTWSGLAASLSGLAIFSFTEGLPRMVVLYIFFAITLAGIYINQRQLRAAGSEGEALARTPGDAWLVRIAISRDLQAVGTDRGIVRFQDHALVFEGERTSFCIGTQDLSDKREMWDFRFTHDEKGKATATEWKLRLRGYAGSLELSLAEMKAPADKRWFEIRKEMKIERKFYSLVNALEAFLEDKQPTSMPRVYPPVMP